MCVEAPEAASRQPCSQPYPGLDVLAFALAVKERVGGILVLPSAFFATQIPHIVALAARNRLPAMYEHRGFIEAGGLMSYGPDHGDLSRRLAVYVDKILKGTKPADLPIEQPTQLELVINLRTAKTFGLTIPLPLLQRRGGVTCGSRRQASTSHPFAHRRRRMTSVFDRRRSMERIVEGGRPIQ